MSPAPVEVEAVAPSAVPAAPESGAVRVAYEEPKREAAAAAREYWLVMLADSPRQNYPIAGVEFCRLSGHYNVNESGDIEGNPPRGTRRFLTDAQVAAIRHDVLNFVVRRSTRPKEGQPWESVVVGDVLDVRGADPKFAPRGADGVPTLTYKPPAPHEPQDEPFGRFIALYECKPGPDGRWHEPENPEPLIARPSGS